MQKSKLAMVPERGFTVSEFEQRCERMQRLMLEEKLDAVVLTTEPHVRYFSGFFTPFWLSPTRPWFLVIPLSGKPIAVIPQIGAALMAQTWLDQVHTWVSPDPVDDGISLLAQACRDLPARFGRIGVALGAQSHLRMPVNDFMALCELLKPADIIDCAGQLHRLLSVKSPAEIAKIQHVCQLASDAFNALPGLACAGDTQREICRKLRIELLQKGADETLYMVAASGQGGYDSIIKPPADTVVENGDVLVIDTGTVFDGYFCDFDRNFGFGRVHDMARSVYRTLYRATDAGLNAAIPGSTTVDIFNAMWRELEAGGTRAGDVGRMGHGLGMQLTEWPSITVDDSTVLEMGMVLTLEPGMGYGENLQMVHEENIVITEDGARLLTRRAADELVIIEQEQ